MANAERIQANNEELLKAIEMAENLPDAGGVANPVIEPLAVTENGTYTAPVGVDGYSPVRVNVPIPDGYIKPAGTLEVTENGEYDVYEKAKVVVEVEHGSVAQHKTCTVEITSNFEYYCSCFATTASDGVTQTFGAENTYEPGHVIVIENVLCDSALYIDIINDDMAIPALYLENMMQSDIYGMFIAPSEQGSVGRVTLVEEA